MNVERYFHRKADQFDALYDEQPGLKCYLNRLLRRGLYERVEVTLAEFRTLKDFAVLDVGCGSGRNSLRFVQAGARRVVGIDFSERMIKLAAELSHRGGRASQCEFIRADFLTYRLEEKFDVVVALGVFDYISPPQPFLRRMVEGASEKIVASFPGVSLVRAPLRKIRYALKGCPVYFYSHRRLTELSRDVGLRSYQIVPCSSSGWMLIGQV